ncbi:hypothetical protein [Streptomyces sp. NPDC020747]|uniref:hypothetical protein n=1 Tax=Streptomyces sp. NPDC020747 TaxID=3365086 RepID=UPI0037977BE0
MAQSARRWRNAAVVMAAAGLLSLGLGTPGASAAEEPRIDLLVLVVDNGDSPVEAVTEELKTTGIPYTTVDLNDSDRPAITEAFLSDTVNGTPRARYQGVVLPNEAPFGAGYLGCLDGPLAFEDNSSSVQESYGYVARPRAGFTSHVDTAVPGGSGRRSLVGEYAHDGRRELVVTFAHNHYQQQFRVLARGVVEWLTQGVHLGQNRNYFSVHVDGVFAPDSRWDTERNCTPGDFDCVGDDGERTTPIRMTAADAVYAAQWQRDSGFTLDMVYNAGAGEERKSENGDGSTRYVSRADISTEISANNLWAASHGLPVDTSELVTGFESYILPQEARTALGHAVGNDPRPHYVHRSNLAEDRLLHPVLDKVLADHRALYADNALLENPRQSAVGTELKRRAAWQEAVAGGDVTAYRVGTTVTAPSGTQIPVTAPEGTLKQLLLGTTAFGTPYAGERSAWTTPDALQTALTPRLPA